MHRVISLWLVLKVQTCSKILTFWQKQDHRATGVEGNGNNYGAQDGKGHGVVLQDAQVV